MKKDRNCGMPYPIYQPMMPGIMPGMMTPNYPANSLEQQVNNLNNQISNLERRVSNLESLVGTNYNSSNYQMM